MKPEKLAKVVAKASQLESGSSKKLSQVKGISSSHTPSV